MARTQSTRQRDRDTYMELVRKFPLRPIKNDDEHEQATEIVGDLMGTKLDAGASDYLDTLILLVTKYEDEHHNPVEPDMTPQEALRALMEANGINQSQIAELLGVSASMVSMFLSGGRGLSTVHIKTLAKRFGLGPEVFL